MRVPKGPWLIASACALLVACGAKTGIDAGERRPADGGRPRDAGFDTFPCRWTVGRPALVAENVSEELARAPIGDVTPRDVVAIVTRLPAGERRTIARYALGDPPRLLDTREVRDLFPHGDLFAHDGGFVHVSETCEVRWLDGDFALLAAAELSPAPCRADRSRPELVTVAHPEDGSVSTVALSSPGAFEARAAAFEARFARAAAHAHPARGTIFVGIGPRGAEIRTAGPDGARIAVRPFGSASDVDVAPDHLLGGIALWRSIGPDVHEVYRVSLADLASPDPELITSAPIDAPPLGRIATNETEALVPLADGRVAILPLNGAVQRFVGPVAADGGEILAMRVILRFADSAGGALYTTRRRDGAASMWFSTLVCNR